MEVNIRKLTGGSSQPKLPQVKVSPHEVAKVMKSCVACTVEGHNKCGMAGVAMMFIPIV